MSKEKTIYDLELIKQDLDTMVTIPAKTMVAGKELVIERHGDLMYVDGSWMHVTTYLELKNEKKDENEKTIS